MRNIISTFVLSLWLMTGISNAQDITNTLAPNGSFKIKSGSTDYLSLSQTNGNLSVFRNLELGGTLYSTPTLGMITKGGLSFLHNYGWGNIFIGFSSGNFSLDTLNAHANVAVGLRTLEGLTTGKENSAFGNEALRNNTTGNYNSAFGSFALTPNTTGSNNSAFGYSSLRNNME